MQSEHQWLIALRMWQFLQRCSFWLLVEIDCHIIIWGLKSEMLQASEIILVQSAVVHQAKREYVISKIFSRMSFARHNVILAKVVDERESEWISINERQNSRNWTAQSKWFLFRNSKSLYCPAIENEGWYCLCRSQVKQFFCCLFIPPEKCLYPLSAVIALFQLVDEIYAHWLLANRTFWICSIKDAIPYKHCTFWLGIESLDDRSVFWRTIGFRSAGSFFVKYDEGFWNLIGGLQQ